MVEICIAAVQKCRSQESNQYTSVHHCPFGQRYPHILGIGSSLG